MNAGSSFLRIVASVVLFIALEALSIVMINNNGVLQRYKIMEAVRSVQSFFWQEEENIHYYFNFRKENERLVEENHILQEKLARYESIEYYRDSVVLDTTAHYSYVPATIIKKSTDKQHNYIILNRGSESGVKVGMGVITENGIVGVVSSVSKRHSYVISFLNTTQNVSVKLANSEIYGPISWNGGRTDMAILRDIPIHKEIEVGDSIMTSGISTIYPSDIPVGVISKFSRNNGLSYDVDVDLFIDYNSVRYVNIVINNDTDEIMEVEGNE